VNTKNSVLGLILVAVTCGCQRGAPPGPVAASATIRGAGGASMVPFIEGAAKTFAAVHPRVESQIAEARSSVAIQKLVGGEADFAFMSRPLRPADVEEAEKKGKSLHMVVIAAEAVSVIVHPTSPLRNVSSSTLRDVFFSGKVVDWADLTAGNKRGPIHVYAVNPKTSGTGELFGTLVTGNDKTAYTKGATLVDYSDVTVGKVAADPDAISFTGMGNVDKTVSAVTIDAVEPTEKNILDTSYLLNRKLFVVTVGLTKGPTREFVKFLLSDAGQHVARAKGFTPIVLD
jgi:phosphate transport system substrate-binding protein